MRTLYVWALSALLTMGLASAQDDDGLPGKPHVGQRTLSGRLLHVDMRPNWKLVLASGEQVWIYPGPELADQLDALPTWIHAVPKRDDTLAAMAKRFHMDLPTLINNNPDPLSTSRAVSMPGCWVELEVSPVEGGAYLAVAMLNRASRFRFVARRPDARPSNAGRWLLPSGTNRSVEVSGDLPLPPEPAQTPPGDRYRTYLAHALLGPDRSPIHVVLEAIQGVVSDDATLQLQPERRGFVQTWGRKIAKLDARDEVLPAGRQVEITKVQNGFGRVGLAWIPMDHVRLAP